MNSVTSGAGTTRAFRLARMAAAALAAAGLLVSVQAQSQAPKPGAIVTAQQKQSADYRGLRASQVIGMSVHDAQGKNIGQIDDMIVDMSTGQVRYAMLRFDPGIMSGERLFAVPTTQLRMAADRDDIVYNVDRAKLEQAAVERSEWNERFLQDRERVARLDRAWGVRQPAQGARAHRASDLIGKNVKSRSGESIGEIEELVINMAQQKVHYAVMEFDQGWGSPERRYVLPLRSFELGRDRDELVLNVDKSKLQAMKSFDQNIYSDLNDQARVQEIDRYFVTVLPTVVTTSRTTTSSTSTARAGADTTQMGAASQRASFDQLDSNRNGWLDRDEIRASADVESRWSSMDRNADGRVSRQEFASGYGTATQRADRN